MASVAPWPRRSSEHRPTRVDRIGIQDHYTESATDEELLDMYCLSAERVAQRVQKLLASDGPVTSLRLRVIDGVSDDRPRAGQLSHSGAR